MIEIRNAWWHFASYSAARAAGAVGGGGGVEARGDVRTLPPVRA